MNRIYKLVLVVEVSARSSFVLSMSVQINVITDINIFVQALRGCGVDAAMTPSARHPAHVRRSLLLGSLDHTCRVLLLGQRLPIGSIGTVKRHTERHTG